ncbi:cysteine hydrolase family protein [Campylobacter upsaliensis]|uniref:nicotinamidase n=1 Tax=Campylobacter upsaliensis TaxID=28080 RepID=A0A381EG22_CAMUP|nr:cysteine hydrolase family protein [Campylobacter upsaliensis]EAL53233.1 pyrazinamidase/nicotinamidase-related protein [Campylobacter upsaliensis RM3195]EHE0559153.1 cysteine hydrolase family protein [Campylobacter upsaliensis]MCR2098009.1 cysteine hydrolase family protein [Campylobacter upsaliensis]MCR2099971.1 cysteine hydrolase family protein [Campylobacter upsaliensis]MCR2101931.1 cysteine hydrolase family protein [Campylobacter upsaliensis]
MKKALVLVDYQNDFIDGSLGFEKALGLKDEILKLLGEFEGDLLITFDTHKEDYLKTREGQNLPIEHCIKGTKGWEMPNEFTPFLSKAKKVFHKDTFGSLELANFLAKSPYEEIHFCGLVSHICVFFNLILAFCAKPNATLILHKNATTSFDEGLENHAFELLKAYGVKLVES